MICPEDHASRPCGPACHIHRNHRLVTRGPSPLTDHEVAELETDFAIDTDGHYVVACLSLKEWRQVLKRRGA